MKTTHKRYLFLCKITAAYQPLSLLTKMYELFDVYTMNNT